MPRRPRTHSRAHVPAHLNTRAPRNRAGVWLGQSNTGERQRHHFAEQWHRQIPGRQKESLRWRARVCACELCARFCGSKRQRSDPTLALPCAHLTMLNDVSPDRYVPLEFNKKNLRFKELSREEVEALSDGAGW